MERINILHGGWYLPQVQRQYVWGERYHSESYVCLLLDSLLKGYPIGGLVLWETTKAVPYREFLNDYALGSFAKQVDAGRWGAHKFLVYDGQQRLQTLRSVLYFSFNGRVLHYDLTFDGSKAESDETGFLFRDKNIPPEPRFLKLTELVSTPCDMTHKTELEDRLVNALSPEKTQQIVIKTNLSSLWEIFVTTNVKAIAYFPVTASNDALVNEVFRRLNTGGIALTQIEMVLSKVKAKYPDYEERLWALSESILAKSGGIRFSSTEALQFFYLLLMGTIRIDEARISSGEVDAFENSLDADQGPLVEVFEGYLWGMFKINHASIIPRWLAVLPICVYLTQLKRCGHKWKIKELKADWLAAIDRYFLLSQFCDWNTQTMVNTFARLGADAGQAGLPFPIDAIRASAIQKNRSDILYYHQFISIPWLATKILTPSRSYVFHEDKPQVDHIFPYSLPGKDDTYKQLVDVLWNFQPMPAGVNNYKRARHPQEYFKSPDGAKYWNDYDYIPDPQSVVWSNVNRFVRYRHLRMRRMLLQKYGLSLKRFRKPTNA